MTYQQRVRLFVAAAIVFVVFAIGYSAYEHHEYDERGDNLSCGLQQFGHASQGWAVPDCD